MNATLTQICEYLRNWFSDPAERKSGVYYIENGTLELDLLEGEYFRIVGSRLNDGVYQYPAYGLADEVFVGGIWRMRIPQSVLDLAADIEAFEADEANKPSPYTSESFGGYSYSKAGSGDGVSAYGWQDAFRSRLNRWRKADFAR